MRSRREYDLLVTVVTLCAIAAVVIAVAVTSVRSADRLLDECETRLETDPTACVPEATR